VWIGTVCKSSSAERRAADRADHCVAGSRFGVRTVTVSRRVALQSWVIVAAILLSTLAFTACDPIISIAGANFPSWLLCMLVGAVLAALVRPLLLLSRLEPNVGPLTVFYPSLIAMLAMIVWVIFFNRT
jgi:YtcA-like protein